MIALSHYEFVACLFAAAFFGMVCGAVGIAVLRHSAHLDKELNELEDAIESVGGHRAR